MVGQNVAFLLHSIYATYMHWPGLSNSSIHAASQESVGSPSPKRFGLQLGAVAASALLTLTFSPLTGSAAWANDQAYEFSCEGGGIGLDLVSVLEGTGEHDKFLELMSRHDPEGFSILADVTLADKTIWAATDAAFSEIEANLEVLSGEQVKEILGNHISPPRRTPWGDYSIVTPDFLLSEGELTHRTRTGVLSGTEQRIKSSAMDGEIRIENATVLPMSWCAEGGSVFSIDSVITEVEAPSAIHQLAYRLERALFYDDSRFIIWPVIFSAMLGVIISTIIRRFASRKRSGDSGGTND